MYRILKRKWFRFVSDRKFSEILVGSAWAMPARVFGNGLGFISSIIVAKFYGADIVGIIAVMNSFLMLTTLFTVMGTNTSILRLIPEHIVKYSPTSSYKLYRKTLCMVIIISIIAGTLLFFSANLIATKLFHKPHLVFYFSLSAVFVVFKSLMLLNTQATRGLKLIRIFALMQILPQSLNLTFLLVLGLMFPTSNVPVYAMLAGFTLSGIFGWIVIGHNFKKTMNKEDIVEHIATKELLSISLPMLMSATATFIIGQTGVIMLTIFRNEAEVGYYAIAVKLAALTALVISAVSTVAAPKFSELFYSGKHDELFHVARKSAKLAFLISCPILAGLFILGRPVLVHVFGKEFIAAYPALLLLAFGQFVNSATGLSTTFMNMTGKQSAYKRIVIATMIINISLNLLLIPKIGLLGAALTSMISICFLNVVTAIYIKLKHGHSIWYLPFQAV